MAGEPPDVRPFAAAIGAIVVCTDVVEHLDDPPHLRQLVEEGATLVLSSPELKDPQLGALLRSAGLAPSFLGLTTNSARDLRKGTALAVVEPPSERDVLPAPADFRVHAVVHAFNERDVIVQTVERLLRQQIEVTLLDNWSTDGTVDIVRSALGANAVRVERFPAEGPTAVWNWGPQLAYSEELLRRQPGGWAIHHDADEIREGPWAGADLRTAIWNVERRGYTAIDHTVVDFRPTREGWSEGADLDESFRWFEFGRRPGHFLQVKAWKNEGQPVGLAESGGHEARFPGMRVFPYKFLCRHYPIRSAAHGWRKVFEERKPRIAPGEHARGWSTHYDNVADDTSFQWDEEVLERFDPATFPINFLVERLTGIGILRGADGLPIASAQ